ncbi:HAMP domain-containing sensor histidine kinase [Mycobacterium sp.]|jgi:signal transduction histidine kinase|uniref:sensor histidine kinase n=1 Tax=Mycobacterium sp. TaxID=1785 RepID=UPI00333FDE2F
MRVSNWGISTRSAIVSATVVFVAVAIAGALLILVLNRSLLSSVDDAAAGRVRDTLSALAFDTPSELDGALLTTDQRVVAVQIINGDGTVVAHSDSAPDTPLIPVTSFGTTMRKGIPDNASPDNDMRISGQAADTAAGRYTVLAAGGSESAEATVRTVAILLAVVAPIVVGVAAMASYRLVKRSLRSVEAIRNRVAEISAAELSERVPVPPQKDEISALATTMNEMLARVEAGHAAQRRFVGDVSHELRSPLATIISALEVAQDYPEMVDDELKKGSLIPEAHRMHALVEDLLLLARADERGLTMREDHVYLDVIAEGDAARVRRDYGLHVYTDLEAVRLTGDISGISRVLRNLLDNAVRHAKSRIEITVAARGDWVVLTVGDDGPGIPVADRVRVFDRFVRIDTDRSREGGGTGLGLAIVAEIVSAHNGTIGIDERPGGGTRVTVSLPAAV